MLCSIAGRTPVAQQHDRDADRAQRRRRTSRNATARSYRARHGSHDRTDRDAARRPSRSRPPSAPASRSAPSPSACRCRTAPPRTRRARCGDDTTTATDASESARSPTRCSSATRSTSGQRRARPRRRPRPSRARPAPRRPRRSSPRTPSRPSAWSRTTPRKLTTAPAPGVVAHAIAASVGQRLGRQRDPVARVGLGGRYGHARQSTEAARLVGPGLDAARERAVATAGCVVTLAAMGPAGDEDREGQSDDRDGVDDDPLEDRRRPAARRAARPLDRLWVHPSELGPVAPARPRDSRATSSRLVVAARGRRARRDRRHRRARPASAPSTATTTPTGARAGRGARAERRGGVLGWPRSSRPGSSIGHASRTATAPGRRAASACGTAARSSRARTSSATPTAVAGDDARRRRRRRGGRRPRRCHRARAARVDGRPMRAAPLADGVGRAGDSVWIFGGRIGAERSQPVDQQRRRLLDRRCRRRERRADDARAARDRRARQRAGRGRRARRPDGRRRRHRARTDGGDPRAYAVPIDTARRRRRRAARERAASRTVRCGVRRRRHAAPGPTVTAVAPDSPADRAGIRAGDVIVAIDGREVLDHGDL